MFSVLDAGCWLLARGGDHRDAAEEECYHRGSDHRGRTGGCSPGITRYQIRRVLYRSYYPYCPVSRGVSGAIGRGSRWGPLSVSPHSHCTVKHDTDIINFACMTWIFVRISASLSALCTNFDQICHWHCISCKILPHFDVRAISVAQKL